MDTDNWMGKKTGTKAYKGSKTLSIPARILLYVLLVSLNNWLGSSSISSNQVGVAQARTFAQPILTPLQEATDTNKIFLPMVNFTEKDWPRAAANPQRTSRTPEEVTGNLHVEWYRPIEAYIPQNVQIIASQGLLFLSP